MHEHFLCQFVFKNIVKECCTMCGTVIHEQYSDVFVIFRLPSALPSKCL